MAIKTLRVFAEYTSTGFVPMPTAGNIDYGYTLASTFPSTTPSSFQTDDPDLDVTVTAMTDFYVWIRINGTAWNPSYTRNVRVYPDSPDINNVVMNMIIATGPAGTSAYSQIVQTSNRLYFNGATTDSVYNSKFAGKTYINELNFGAAPQLATVATSGAYADLTGKPALSTVATSGSYADLSNKPSGTAPISYNSGTNSFQISVASASTNGYLTSTDWSTFNAKYLLPTGGTTAQYLRGDGTLATFPTTLDSNRLIFTGRNSTGSTLTKGTVVYINGVSGNTALLAKAIASADSTSAQTLGVIENDIANNATGTVVLVGAVGNLDTSSFTEGVQLYLSGTVAGAFTSSKVLAPTHIVYVGIVTRAHPTQGVIEVKVQNGYELDELHDVAAQTPTNNDGLFYESSTNLWKNKSIITALGYTPYNATNPNNYIALTALSASAPLSYNNTTGAFSITQANTSTNGFLSSTDWNTFNSKQNALTLGNVTEVASNVLMFPDGGTGKTIGNLTIQVKQSSASQPGFLSSADWTTFNNKQNAITLTTTGTSGAATLSGATLNIPQYQTALTNPVTGTGTTNTVPKFTSASAIGNSNITDNGTSVSIGGTGNVNINNLIGGTVNRTLATGNTFSGQTINLTRTDNTSSLINRTQFNYNEDGFSGGGSSQEIVSTINRSTNQSGLYANLALSSFQAGSGSIGEITTLSVVVGAGGGTGAVTDVNFIRGRTGPGIQNFPITNLTYINFGQPLTGTITNYRGINIGDFTGTTLSRALDLNLAAGTNKWNIFAGGTANNYMAGSLGIGTTGSLSTTALVIGKNITGGTNAGVLFTNSTIQSDVTGAANIFYSQINTQAATFTLSFLRHYTAVGGTVGSGSVITTQSGFEAGSSLTGATNNYGFRGLIPAGSGRWNLFMDGTANNYLAGSLGIGSTTLTGTNLTLGKQISGAVSSNGVVQQGSVLSDVTTQAFGFYNIAQISTGTALPLYVHYATDAAAFIGTVTTQVGFRVGSSLTGATTNYGFQGAIAAGTNRWNLYMNGTANNYLAGNLGIGITAPVGEGSDDILTHIHNPATTGAARAMIRLTNGYTGSAWGNGSFITVDSSQGLYIGNSEAAPMLLFTSGAERMRITSAGNVGIGTSSPLTLTNATTLHINGTSSAFLTMGYGGTRYLTMLATSGYAAISTTGATPLTFETNEVERMRITSDGKLQVGGNPSIGGINEPGKISLFQNDSKVYSSSGNFDSDLFVVRVNGSIVSNQTASLQLVASGNNGTNAGRAIISVVQTNQGLSSGDIVFQNNSGGTIAERMRIASNGRVGIGGTPLTGLDGGATTIYGCAIIQTTSSGNYNENIRCNRNTNNDYASIILGGAYNSTSGTGVGQWAMATNPSAAGYRFLLGYNGTDHFQITTGGNFLFGTSSDNGERIYVSGSIRATGNITANSDLVLKKNLTLVDNPIDKLNQLNGYLYQWKENDEYQYGVIAQEVEKILPHAVQTGANGIKGVAYNQLIPVMIEAIKEQNKKIVALEAKLG